MTEFISYNVDKTAISQQKMQFSIINRRPKYPAKTREAVKTEIEKQLFAVFCKYVPELKQRGYYDSNSRK